MYSKNIIFTGAGFTANWGGFLNDEMWSHIFNQREIQDTEKIRQVLLQYFRFEFALEIIQSNLDYSDIERAIMLNAVDNAFDQLDSIIKQRGDVEPAKRLQAVREFITSIFGRGHKGFFFTLNQDLFVERFLFCPHRLRPGINLKYHILGAPAGTGKWAACKVPSDDNLRKNGEKYLKEAGSDNVVYIKLHGSHDWVGSSGLGVKVIGGGKGEIIEREPLLQFYFRVFKNTLFQKNSKILIIGYGFQDEHINQVLKEAIKNYGLRVYVISPLSPEELRNEVIKSGSYEIWEGLSGYHPYKFGDLIPFNKTSWGIVNSLVFNV